MSRVAAVFADGGCIGSNPSSLAGTWAWCHVDANGQRVAHEYGVLHPVFGPVTNNLAEFAAAIMALEALPEKWSGNVCLDSMITLGRLCEGSALNNIPIMWVVRGGVALTRLGKLIPVQLKGHPSAAELRAGRAHSGAAVSEHNVFCDELCRKAAVKFMERRELAAG